MSSLKKLKEALHKHDIARRYPSPPDHSIVRDCDLRWILNAMEGDDAAARVKDNEKHPVDARWKLNCLIRLMWMQNNESADEILHVFSSVIAELSDEKSKRVNISSNLL